MGPRPGSIAAIEADPRGALIAELERPSASQLAASALPSSSKAFRTVNEANAKRAGQNDHRRESATGSETTTDVGRALHDGGRRAGCQSDGGKDRRRSRA